MNDTVLWYASRASGVMALVLLTGVSVGGLLVRLRWSSSGLPRFVIQGLHRNVALLSLVFLAVHVVTAVVDPFTSLGAGAALVPFSSGYRRLWLGLGVVALDLLLAVIITSLVRGILGFRAWRLVHWLAYASWGIALVHGLGTGTDGGAAWLRTIDVVCLSAVAAALVWRVVGAPENAAPALDNRLAVRLP